MKKVDAISLIVELIVSLGMYLGLFFKKNWVFRSKAREETGMLVSRFNATNQVCCLGPKN